MSANVDRLYELLPAIYRIRDAEQGEPLKSLLRVIAEQVNLVEEDIARLYDNWFIETCEDWVVPYIADLVGYRPVHEAGEPGDVRSEQGRARNQILIPRREVANTLRYRRRKGTLALLELLATTCPAGRRGPWSFISCLDGRRRSIICIWIVAVPSMCGRAAPWM